MANNEMHLSSQRSKYTASINAPFRGCIITDRYRRVPQSSIPFDPASPKWVRNTGNSEGFVRLEQEPSAENGRRRYSEGWGFIHLDLVACVDLRCFCRHDTQPRRRQGGREGRWDRNSSILHIFPCSIEVRARPIHSP